MKSLKQPVCAVPCEELRGTKQEQKKQQQAINDAVLTSGDELPPLERLRRDLVRFYHHPDNVMFAENHNNNTTTTTTTTTTNIDQQNQPPKQESFPLPFFATIMSPIQLREVYQADLEKVMIEIPPAPSSSTFAGNRDANKANDDNSNVHEHKSNDASKHNFKNLFQNVAAVPHAKYDEYTSYDPVLLAKHRPEKTESSLREWCNNLFFAPLFEKKATFVTTATAEREAAVANVPEPKKKKRFEALVEGPPGCGKTELAKRICREQPFEDALALYLPLHRINYSPNEVNKFEELLQLAMGVSIVDGPDPEIATTKGMGKLNQRKDEEEEEEAAKQKKKAREVEEQKQKQNPGQQPFRWPEDGERSSENGEDDDGDNNNQKQQQQQQLQATIAENAVHMKFKFDSAALDMIENFIAEIIDFGEACRNNTCTNDDDDDDGVDDDGDGKASAFGGSPSSIASSTFYPSYDRKSLASAKKNRLRQLENRDLSSPLLSPTSASSPAPLSPASPSSRFARATRTLHEPIRIVWVVDDLDAVDRGPERTQNFIRDFVSPSGRRSESLQVLRNLYSTPVRSTDSVLCFSRDRRNGEACVFNDVNFPARRFIFERWTTQQTEEATFAQVYSKMCSMFDVKAVDTTRLRQLVKDVSNNNNNNNNNKSSCTSSALFSRSGAFRASPFLIEVFAEVVCQLAKRNQPPDRFDRTRFSLPSNESLAPHIRQFASPLVLFEKFVTFRIEKYFATSPLFAAINNNNNNNAQPPRQPHAVALQLAGKLANEMLTHLHEGSADTMLTFTFKQPQTNYQESQMNVKKKPSPLPPPQQQQQQQQRLVQTDPLEYNWWAEALYCCGLLLKIDGNNVVELRQQQQQQKPLLQHSSANPPQLHLPPLPQISYQFRRRSEMEFFAALWALNPSTIAFTNEKDFTKKIKEEIPFERDTHRVVWVALAAHAVHAEREEAAAANAGLLKKISSSSSYSKSQIIMSSVAAKYHDAYARHRVTIPKHDVHAITRQSLPMHQDAINTALIVELTGVFPVQTFFDCISKQHGLHWTLPSHFFWAFPECGRFGLVETMKDLLKRISENRDKDRNKPNGVLWQMLLQNIQVSSCSEPADPEMIKAVRDATAKTHLIVPELPRVRTTLKFPQRDDDDGDGATQKTEKTGHTNVSDDHGKKKETHFDLEKAKQVTTLQQHAVVAGTKISDSNIQSKVRSRGADGNDDDTNNNSAGRAGLQATAAESQQRLAADEGGGGEEEIRKEKKRLERDDLERKGEAAYNDNAPPASPVLPQAQISSFAPKATDGWEKMFKKASQISTGATSELSSSSSSSSSSSKTSSDNNANVLSPATRSSTVPERYRHLAGFSLPKKVSPLVFKQYDEILAQEDLTRKRIEQVCLATASTQFQISKFYFKNWVVDSNFARDLWNVGAEKRSGGNDCWFSTFPPIRRVVDGDGIRGALELDKYSNNAIASKVNAATASSTTTTTAAAAGSTQSSSSSPISSNDFSERLRTLETGICRADTAEAIFGRDKQTGKHRCRLALLEGPPHVGKTTFAQQLCVMQPFFGRVCIYIPFATLLTRHPNLIDNIETFIKTMQIILQSLPFRVDFNVPFVWVLDEIDCVDRSFDRKLSQLLKNFSDAASCSSLMTQRSFSPCANGDERLGGLGGNTNNNNNFSKINATVAAANMTPRTNNVNNNKSYFSQNRIDTFSSPPPPSQTNFYFDPSSLSSADPTPLDATRRPGQQQHEQQRDDQQSSSATKSGRPHDLCLVISREIRENGGCFLDPSDSDGSSEIPLERWYLGPWSPLLVKRLAFEYWRRLCSPVSFPLQQFYTTVQQVCSLPAMRTMCQRPKLLAMVCRLAAVGRIGGKKCPDELLAKLTPVAVFMMDLAERAQGRVKFGAFKKLVANIAPIAVRSVASGFPFRLSAAETYDPAFLEAAAIATATAASTSSSSTRTSSASPTPVADGRVRSSVLSTPRPSSATLSTNHHLLPNHHNPGYGSSLSNNLQEQQQHQQQGKQTPPKASSSSSSPATTAARNNSGYLSRLDKEMESPDWLANLVILGLVRSEFVVHNQQEQQQQQQGNNNNKKSVIFGTQFGTPFLYTAKNGGDRLNDNNNNSSKNNNNKNNNNNNRSGSTTNDSRGDDGDGDSSLPSLFPITPIANYLEQENSKSINIIFSKRHDVEYLAAVGLLEHATALKIVSQNSMEGVDLTGETTSFADFGPQSSIGKFVLADEYNNNNNNNNNSNNNGGGENNQQQQQQQRQRSIPPWNISLRQSWYLCALSASDKNSFLQLATASATPVLTSSSLKNHLAVIFASIMIVEISSAVPAELLLSLLHNTNNLQGTSEALFMMCGVLGSAKAIDFFMNPAEATRGASSASSSILPPTSSTTKSKRPAPISFSAVFQCFVRACLHGDCCYSEDVYDALLNYSRGTTLVTLSSAAHLGSVGCLTWLLEKHYNKKPDQLREELRKRRLKAYEKIVKGGEVKPGLIPPVGNSATVSVVAPPPPPRSSDDDALKIRQQVFEGEVMAAKKILESNRDPDGLLVLEDVISFIEAEEKRAQAKEKIMKNPPKPSSSLFCSQS